MDILDSLWIEKYRPKTIDEIILTPEYRKDFEKYIEKQSIGNILLTGGPGSGKSTIAFILCSKYGVLFNKRSNLLLVNGSAKKSRGIGYVDNVIEPFLKIPPANDKYKIVFIDEVDKFTTDGFDSLRGIIEKYHKQYGRFIFTCNYISKIPDAIQSRFTMFRFKQMPIEYVINFTKKILDSELIEYDEKDLKFVINNLYPDVRKIINEIQRASSSKSKDPKFSGRLEVNSKAIITTEKLIIGSMIEIISSLIKKENHKIGKNVNNIIQLMDKNEPDFSSLYQQLFFNDKIPPQAKIVINEFSNSHQNCLIPNMHFIGMVFKVIMSLKDYMKLRP